MYGRFPTYVAVLLCGVSLSVAGCEGGGATPTTPAVTTAAKSSLTAEPLVATPEFFSSSTCPTQPPFGVRVNVIVGGADLIVRGVRIGFTDSFGNATVPDVFVLPPGTPATLPPGAVPSPTPGFSTIPNSSPIPIPGAPPVNGVLVSNRTSVSLPLQLRFPCGVFPEGTVFLTGEIVDLNGTPQSPQARIALRRTGSQG